MNLRNACTTLAAAAAISGGQLLAADPVRPAVQPGAQAQFGVLPLGQAGQRAQEQTADQMLASCLAISNQEEIAIAEFAESKSSNKDVKEFASMLARDHKAFLEKIQRFAPEATRSNFLSQSTNEATSKGETQPAGAANPAAARTIQQTAGTQVAPVGPGQPIDILQLHRELAQQCLTDSKKMLSEKKGNHMDECFVGHQIARHAGMKTQLTVFQRHTTPELTQILAEASATTSKHLEAAEKLMQDLAKDSSKRSVTKTE